MRPLRLFLAGCSLPAFVGIGAASAWGTSAPDSIPPLQTLSRSPAAPLAILRAGSAGGPIRVDGVLDEPDWLGAGVIPDLTQSEPQPGGETAFRTEVRVLIGRDALYFGFTCVDPEPQRISVHTMQRDASLESDDFVAIVLDTFGDRRTGYAFRMNSVGARKDGLIYGPDNESTEWDGLWAGTARRTPTGWSAEFAIPARTLHFDPGLASWGLNIQRFVSRGRIYLRWCGISLDANLIDMRRAGRLDGVEILQQGRGLSAIPYGLVRYHRDRNQKSEVTTGDPGLDLSYNLTPNLTGVLTVNTDFAETEVDARQINLTRFPLFFPEKRAFFLEGSSQFDFGSGLGEDFIPFFSRRIGLFKGTQVPIRGGVKVLGKGGRVGIGVVDATTDDTDGAKATNLLAARFTYDVGSHARVGTLLTDGEPSGLNQNRLYGVDALWQTSSFRGDKNLSLGGWYVKSNGDLARAKKDGWGLSLDYPNDRWSVYAIAKELGDGLEPGLGFLPRPGARFYDLGGAYQPRPDGGPFGWVRQFFFEVSGRRVDSLDGTPESWEIFTAPFNAVTQSGEHLEVNWSPRYERLDVPFEVDEGVDVPAGRYRFTRYRIEGQSSPHRPWRVGSTVWFGAFYRGDLTQVEGFMTYTLPPGRLQLEMSTENDFGALPGGSFIQRLHQLKVQYSFTPDLWTAAFVQYDSESDNFGLNARFRWTFRPGCDLYLVWNRAWERSPDEGALQGFAPRRDEVVVKTRWTFQM